MASPKYKSFDDVVVDVDDDDVLLTSAKPVSAPLTNSPLAVICPNCNDLYKPNQNKTKQNKKNQSQVQFFSRQQLLTRCRVQGRFGTGRQKAIFRGATRRRREWGRWNRREIPYLSSR
jgi:hypothetical protein